MGLLPATGTEIAMGKVYRAFGLSAAYPPADNTDIGLNSTLGANREPPQAFSTTAIPAGTETTLSEDFGGLTTAESYPSDIFVRSTVSNLVTSGYGTVAEPWIFTVTKPDWTLIGDSFTANGIISNPPGVDSPAGCPGSVGNYYVYSRSFGNLFEVLTPGDYKIYVNIVSFTRDDGGSQNNFRRSGINFSMSNPSLDFQLCVIDNVDAVLNAAIAEPTKTYTYTSLSAGNTITDLDIIIEQHMEFWSMTEFQFSVGFEKL